MIYEILAVTSLILTTSLLVYTHMLRIQLQRQQGKIALYCEQSRELISKMSGVLVEQEGALNDLIKKSKENPVDHQSTISIKDVMANIDGAAIADGDLE
jgi:hypothetical protein